MKLIAVDKEGKRCAVREVLYDSVVGAVVRVYNAGEWLLIPRDATLHISTCMTDKNGQEILVGDNIKRIGILSLSRIVFDGYHFYALVGLHFDVLTPELAARSRILPAHNMNWMGK